MTPQAIEEAHRAARKLEDRLTLVIHQELQKYKREGGVIPQHISVDLLEVNQIGQYTTYEFCGVNVRFGL